jgi:hypothetical protein
VQTSDYRRTFTVKNSAISGSEAPGVKTFATPIS